MKILDIFFNIKEVNKLCEISIDLEDNIEDLRLRKLIKNNFSSKYLPHINEMLNEFDTQIEIQIKIESYR